MDLVIDIKDQSLEKLSIQLDELIELRRKYESESTLTSNATSARNNIEISWNKESSVMIGEKTNVTIDKQKPTMSTYVGSSVNLSTFTKRCVIQKPQDNFTDKIDNSILPFVPKIRQKPNALRPLSKIFEKLDDPKLNINDAFFKRYPELLENPYSFEIERFDLPLMMFYASKRIEKPLPLETTPYKYIDKTEDLIWLCHHLGKSNRSSVREIAVDLEHHSFRSFLGFTCLMQISTRTHDFVLDTLKLRAEMHRLNEIFTDWTLIKVLHGSDSDIEWLQKDFGIYVVNMFDTGQAARVLNYPQFSLSYLLQRFCQIQAQKHFQLADWRQRPLDDAMIKYAREDTHYLLYIYDCLRKELLESRIEGEFRLPLQIVHDKSKAICKKVFQKPRFYSKNFLKLCQACSHFNSNQIKALLDLYHWRDSMAREFDESIEYVLRIQHLVKIAELLPTEFVDLMTICIPISNIVESHLHEIINIVKEARDCKAS